MYFFILSLAYIVSETGNETLYSRQLIHLLTSVGIESKPNSSLTSTRPCSTQCLHAGGVVLGRGNSRRLSSPLPLSQLNIIVQLRLVLNIGIIYILIHSLCTEALLYFKMTQNNNNNKTLETSLSVFVGGKFDSKPQNPNTLGITKI